MARNTMLGQSQLSTQKAAPSTAATQANASAAIADNLQRAQRERALASAVTSAQQTPRTAQPAAQQPATTQQPPKQSTTPHGAYASATQGQQQATQPAQQPTTQPTQGGVAQTAGDSGLPKDENGLYPSPDVFYTDPNYQLPDGQYWMGWSVNGEPYTNPAGTQPLPIGAIFTDANGVQWVNTEQGYMQYQPGTPTQPVSPGQTAPPVSQGEQTTAMQPYTIPSAQQGGGNTTVFTGPDGKQYTGYIYGGHVYTDPNYTQRMPVGSQWTDPSGKTYIVGADGNGVPVSNQQSGNAGNGTGATPGTIPSANGNGTTTTYTGPDGQQHTGYIYGGHVYTDPAHTQPMPAGSQWTDPNGKIYYVGADGTGAPLQTTTYTDPNGQQQTGYISNGHVYADPTYTTPMPNGSMWTDPTGKTYYVGKDGNVTIVNLTTYTDANGQQHTGYIYEGHVYTDPEHTQRMPVGSTWTAANGNTYYVGADGNGILLDKNSLMPWIDAQFNAAQQRIKNSSEYETQRAANQLQRALQDAQPSYQDAIAQQLIDAKQAQDAAALYAEQDGSRGGIGLAQWNSIANTGAKTRQQIAAEQRKMATDTARQMADLRAQGKYEEADKLLQLQQQRFAADYEELVRMQSQQETNRQTLANFGWSLAQAGIMPTDKSVLDAMSVPLADLQAYINAVNLASGKPTSTGSGRTSQADTQEPPEVSLGLPNEGTLNGLLNLYQRMGGASNPAAAEAVIKQAQYLVDRGYDGDAILAWVTAAAAPNVEQAAPYATKGLPNESALNGILNIYQHAGGGDAGLSAISSWLDYYGNENYDAAAIADWIESHSQLAP